MRKFSMGLGMRLLRQLDVPNKSPKPSGYDLNRPVPSSSYKSRSIDFWYRDFLALGLYCCNHDPSLAEMLIDYYIQIDSTDICYCEWVEVKKPEFPDPVLMTEPQHRELAVLAQLLPVLEWTGFIVDRFPKRQQTNRLTLLMLHFCSDFVGEAIDNVEHGVDLPTKLLAIMQREYAKYDIR